MKRKNNKNSLQHKKEDFGFLQDRMQLLNTIREMIDIELELRGLKTEGNPHPEKPPPENEGCDPPKSNTHRRSLWQHIVSILSSCL